MRSTVVRRRGRGAAGGETPERARALAEKNNNVSPLPTVLLSVLTVST